MSPVIGDRCLDVVVESLIRASQASKIPLTTISETFFEVTCVQAKLVHRSVNFRQLKIGTKVTDLDC
jgi:hypothetical protein